MSGEGESKPRGRWSYRSAPYSWERVLMWVLIAACIGDEAAGRALHAFLALVLP